MDAYMNEQLDAEIEPTLLCEHHHRGDVTDLVVSINPCKATPYNLVELSI